MKKRVISSGAWFSFAMLLAAWFGRILVDVTKPWETDAKAGVAIVGATLMIYACIVWVVGALGAFDE